MTQPPSATPRPTLRALLRDVLCDPGFGFAICGIIYASKSTTAAQICAFACVVLIVALRFARNHAHSFTTSARVIKHLHNDGLSLQVLGIIGLASSLATLNAITQGHYTDATLPLLALQAGAAVLFAVANFMLAASMSGCVARSHRASVRVLLQPETWLLGGMACLGLMTGLDALIIMPLLVTGYMITLSNVRHNRAAHHGHPKLFYAAATLGFAAISPDGWLLFANILNAVCLVVIEHRLTPHGLMTLCARRQAA